jgi:hypothetical protein
MKIRPLYKNLDTGFVNLSALLRYLRQKGFVGLVRVDINEYRAEISFDEARKVRMREFVNGTGLAAEGSGALQRLLVTARAEGGVINVYEAMRPVTEEIQLDDILDLDQSIAVKNKTEPKQPELKRDAKPSAPKIPKPAEKIFSSSFPNGNGNGNGNNGNGNGTHYGDISSTVEPEVFPVYSNPVEVVEDKPESTKYSYLSAPDWEELTSVTAELLGTADEVLKAAHLGFPDAFNKARVEVSSEYPFLDPDQGIFLYAHGGVMLKQEVAPELLVSGVCECLRRILNKLVANPKFFALYRRITQQTVILIRRRQPQFDKFGYTRQLEKIIKF